MASEKINALIEEVKALTVRRFRRRYGCSRRRRCCRSRGGED